MRDDLLPSVALGGALGCGLLLPHHSPPRRSLISISATRVWCLLHVAWCAPVSWRNYVLGVGGPCGPWRYIRSPISHEELRARRS